MLNVHIVNSLQYGWAYCVTALHSVYSTLYRIKWHGLKQYKLQNSVAVNMNMHRALLTMCMCCFSTFWFAFGISVLCFKLEFSTKCATHTYCCQFQWILLFVCVIIIPHCYTEFSRRNKQSSVCLNGMVTQTIDFSISAPDKII